MNGLDPAMMQRMQQIIQQNPRVAMLLQKPGLMQKLQSIAQHPNDPMIAQQYASDPDVQELIQILGPAMGMNQDISQYHQVQPHNESAPNLTHIHSQNQFIDIINKAPRDKLIVCDFFATWCGPCKGIAPQFERLAKLYGKDAIFIKVDVDRNRVLAQSKKIAAMPTFHFYKNKEKIDEMRGANVNKLEQLITAHITSALQSTENERASPFSNFPLHEENRPIYTKAPFKKMKDKLKQLNNQLNHGEKKEDKKYSLNDSEWILLNQLIVMLQDRATYNQQKFNATHYQVLDKLLKWPSHSLPPVLDLIRVLSLHPSFAEHCSKNIHLITKILKIGGNGLVNAVNGMLTCRIVINLFNRRITAMLFEKHYTLIVDHLFNNMMVIDRKNTRLAFVRVLLHYAYCYHLQMVTNNKSKYGAEKIQCFTLFTEILYREEAIDIILNILMGIGTLLFRDRNVIQFANSLDIEMVFTSYKQKYENNKQIATCCDELIKAIQNPDL